MRPWPASCRAIIALHMARIVLFGPDAILLVSCYSCSSSALLTLYGVAGRSVLVLEDMAGLSLWPLLSPARPPPYSRAPKNPVAPASACGVRLPSDSTLSASFDTLDVMALTSPLLETRRRWHAYVIYISNPLDVFGANLGLLR